MFNKTSSYWNLKVVRFRISSFERLLKRYDGAHLGKGDIFMAIFSLLKLFRSCEPHCSFHDFARRMDNVIIFLTILTFVYFFLRAAKLGSG